MIKKFANAKDFKDCNVSRGGAHCGVSLWVSKSVFIGMTQDKFIGKFKVRDIVRRGREKTSDVMNGKINRLPCELTIHMSSCVVGQKASAKVTLLDWGMIDDDNIGVIISGIVQ